MPAKKSPDTPKTETKNWHIHAKRAVQDRFLLDPTKLVLSTCFLITILIIAGDEFYRGTTTLEGLLHTIWPNVLVALVLYILLENGLSEKINAPTRNRRHHKEIIRQIAKAKHVRILDISISEFLKHENEFTAAIKEALSRNAKIEILLLHPNTYAALQRNYDLKGQTKTEMMHGLQYLFKLIKEDPEISRNHQNFHVRLFKSTAPMSFIGCDKVGYFTIFPPKDKADTSRDFILNLGNSFGGHLDDIFYKIWSGKAAENDKDETADKNPPIELIEFMEAELIVTMGNKEEVIKHLKWGGDEDEDLSPTYLAWRGHGSSVEHFKWMLKPGSIVTIKHDGEKKVVKIIGKFLDPSFWEMLDANARQMTHGEIVPDQKEFELMANRIAGTYGDDYGKFRKQTGYIFKIAPAYEVEEVQTEENEVSQKLASEKDGYFFLSHKRFDLALTKRFLYGFTELNKEFQKMAKSEEYLDPRDKMPGAKSKRRRQFKKFEVSFNNLEMLPIGWNEVDNVHIAIHKGGNEKVPLKLIHKHDEIIKFLEILIEFDIRTLEPTDKIDNSRWKGEVHLIKIQVAKNEIQDPTPCNISNYGQGYVVLHLICRRNINGGVTYIYNNNKFDKHIDNYLLEKPLDTLYINDAKKSHRTTEIKHGILDEPEAYRDILVIYLNKA